MTVKEIDNVEYTKLPGRQPVTAFKMGDRIGEGHMLITKSEESPNDPDYRCLTWIADDGTPHEWEGGKNINDIRWYQSLYVIQEIP